MNVMRLFEVFFLVVLMSVSAFCFSTRRINACSVRGKARSIHSQRNIFVIAFSSVALFTVQPLQASAAAQWSTFLNPFSSYSQWNARPVAPVLGTFVIPQSTYYPSVSSGAYSTGMFLSKATDAPVVVKGLVGTSGIWDPDAEAYRSNITIPHWPADVLPAAGSDGHADIVDLVNNMIHSFWKLQNQNGQWVAAQYAWSNLSGRGWGDPAHYYQGSRATGVPTSAGLMRKHEVNDGLSIYHHALAMSLTFNALAPNPTYVFPATSADGNALTTNTGAIPEGALMLLPATYDTASIANSALRKVAETLKVYGAYVIDRNVGTPFAIYVENGADFNLMPNGWDNAVAAELDRMRAALRQVVSTSGWLDGNGNQLSPQKVFNVLSMRGASQLQIGTVPGVFDTWQQAVVFPATLTQTVQVNYSSRGLGGVTWASPRAGAQHRLTAIATGGAKLHLKVSDIAGAALFDSGELGNGESIQFAWPVNWAHIVVYTLSGVGQPSSVKGDLRPVW